MGDKGRAALVGCGFCSERKVPKVARKVKEPLTPCPSPFSRPGGRPQAPRGRGRRLQAGFTILETAVASALLVLFLTSLFALNSTVMRMLRSASETATASQEAQARLEQVRLANWNQITRSTWVHDTLLTQLRTDAVVFDDLPGMSERVEGWRTGGAAAAYAVTRDATGAVNATTSADLSAEDLIYVHVIVSWTSWGGRARSRELVTIVSRWGISK